MSGIFWAIIAGAAMSIQGVLNTRLGQKTGLLEANAFVQGTAFVLSFVIAWLFGKGDIGALFSSSPVYWLGGIAGVAITVTVMLAMGAQSPAVAVSVILVAQLAVAAFIDCFGLFGTDKIPFGINKLVGLFLIISGIIVYKYK